MIAQRVNMGSVGANARPNNADTPINHLLSNTDHPLAQSNQAPASYDPKLFSNSKALSTRPETAQSKPAKAPFTLRASANEFKPLSFSFLS